MRYLDNTMGEVSPPYCLFFDFGHYQEEKRGQRASIGGRGLKSLWKWAAKNGVFFFIFNIYCVGWKIVKYIMSYTDIITGKNFIKLITHLSSFRSILSSYRIILNIFRVFLVRLESFRPILAYLGSFRLIWAHLDSLRLI